MSNNTLADLTKRVDPAFIYPEFWKICMELLVNCQKRGADYFIISGYRSQADQLKLWTQGRTQPGKIVTNAGPWQSYHNYGLALDFCRDANVERAGLQPDWDTKAYEVLGEEAAKLGIEWGGSWKTFKDVPHCQIVLPGGLKLKDLPRDLAKAWVLIDSEVAKNVSK